ncbi:hypothetical protein ACFV7O_21670 [Streptomyces tendae]|uniref:hypothetical protein n=1 Tax=Streptomyces tendae TaxID=1932 RepID=UPI003661A554
MTETALDKARRAAEAAAAKLAELERQEENKAAQAAAGRAERAQEYDRAFLARWSAIATEARDGERPADTYDPATMGFLEDIIRFATGREKRRYVMDKARSAEASLGVPSARSTVPDDRPYKLDLVGRLERIVMQEVQRRADDFAESVEAEREAFVNGE